MMAASLQLNWVTEGLIDFEYKKYILLAYLQQIAKEFDEKKLYPFLSDLYQHYNNLITIRNQQREVKDAMPKRLTRIEIEKLQLHYEAIMNDADYMEEVVSILEYAIPRIEKEMKMGREVYDFVEDAITIEPIGLTPLNKNFGYMFVSNGNLKKTRVFEYELSIFEQSSEKFRAIKTMFVNEYQCSFTNTYENIKVKLLKENKNLPNPATYLIYSKIKFPFQETLLPIAKRCLVRKVSSASTGSAPRP